MGVRLECLFIKVLLSSFVVNIVTYIIMVVVVVVGFDLYSLCAELVTCERANQNYRNINCTEVLNTN